MASATTRRHGNKGRSEVYRLVFTDAVNFAVPDFIRR